MKIRFSFVIALCCALLACSCGGRGSSSSSSSSSSRSPKSRLESSIIRLVPYNEGEPSYDYEVVQGKLIILYPSQRVVCGTVDWLNSNAFEVGVGGDYQDGGKIYPRNAALFRRDKVIGCVTSNPYRFPVFNLEDGCVYKSAADYENRNISDVEYLKFKLVDKDGGNDSDDGDTYRDRGDDDGGYARRGRKKGSLSEVFDRVIKDNVRDDVREEEIDEEGDAYRSYRQSVMEDEEDEIDEEGDAYRSYRQSVMEDEESGEGVLGGETKRFSGAIMSKDKKKSYNIYLEVVESGTDGSVSGHYRYMSQPADRTIPLYGKVTRNGDVLRFKLFSTGGTEAFEFKGEDGEALSGTWRQYKNEADRDAGTSPSKELVVFLTE